MVCDGVFRYGCSGKKFKWQAPLIKTRNVRHRSDRFNECRRRLIAAASLGYPGPDGAGSDVRNVPGFGQDIVGRLPMGIKQLSGWLPPCIEGILLVHDEMSSGLKKRYLFSSDWIGTLEVQSWPEAVLAIDLFQRLTSHFFRSLNSET